MKRVKFWSRVVREKSVEWVLVEGDDPSQVPLKAWKAFNKAFWEWKTSGKLFPLDELEAYQVAAREMVRAAEKVKAHLVADIAAHGGCLQTGFLGTSFLMDALSECGAYDVCYTLLLQHKNPSWLYSVDQGATTIWERWNSYTKDKGFGPVGMNSFNHYAYGQVLGWMYRNIAGIAADPAKPGFRNIIMKPIPDKRLGSAKAEYRSRAGLITSAWRYEGEKWIWDFTVPEGATATVTVPGEPAKLYVAGIYRIER